MKHQNVLRILAIVFAMVMMLAIASCDLFKPEVTTTAHVHSEKVLEAVEATCTETGLTEGKKCTTCGQVTVPQQVVPAKGHTDEIVDAVAATCTSIGLTEGKKCSVCDVTLVAQEIVPAKGHTEADVAAVPATCTQQGLTAGKKCSVCDTILAGQTLTPALGHTEGEAATCTTAQTCTVCKAELAPAKGHTWGTEVTTVTAATCAVDGKGTVKCTACDATKEEVIPATGEHTWDAGVITVAPSCADGKRLHTCSVCNGTKEEAIPGNGQHVYGEEIVVAPNTCITTGYKSKTCTVCNTEKKVVLLSQKTEGAKDAAGKVIPYQHNFGEDGKCTDCGTCKEHTYTKYTTKDFDDPRYDLVWGFCEECGYVDPDHEHIIKNGVCYYCEYVYDEVPQPSIFDNDGDGKDESYYFSQALPERFRENLIYVNGKRDDLSTNYSYYDEIDAGSGNMPYPHHYVKNVTSGQYLLYNVEVEEAGLYEVAIYLRVKDEYCRVSKFTINEGTPSEYSFMTSYEWPTASDRAEVQNNDFLIGTYMFVEMELHAGVNTIKVTAPFPEYDPNIIKTQHIRALFFHLKEEKHVHGYELTVQDATCSAEGLKTYTCSCGDVVKETIPVNPTAHAVNEEYVCTLCNKNMKLTLEEAIALGNTFEKDKYGDEIYWIELTLNHQANADGFARASTAEGILFSVKQYKLLEGQAFPKKGDTILFCGKIGAVNSATQGKEGRLFEAQIVKVIAECDHAAGFTAATCVSPKICKTCGRLVGEKDANAHDWAEATCAAPKTCTVCGATEGEAAEGHQLDENYKCTVCGKNFLLTMEEAIALGMTYNEGKYGDEVYYVIVTLNKQAGATGFGRSYLTYDGLSFTLNSTGYTLTNDLTYPSLGDTILVCGNIGNAKSYMNATAKEARMYNVTLLKNFSVNCEHEWLDATCDAPKTCSKCKGVDPESARLEHTLDENHKCTVCNRNFHVTIAEANEIGNKVEQPSKSTAAKVYSADYYYVTVTVTGIDYTKTTGFFRAQDENGTTLCINNIVLAEGEELPAEGTVITLYGRFARLYNAKGPYTSEVRMMDAVIVPAQ